VCALVFLSVSIAAGAHAYRNMQIGSTAQMGAGFFPLMLSFALGILSLVSAFAQANSTADPPQPFVPWKSFIAIIGSPILFALTINSLGLALSILIVVFTASFASRFATLSSSAKMAAGMSLFCIVVFKWGLGLPLPLVGYVILDMW
jgi:hypothetical protein